MSDILTHVFSAIAGEADANPKFRERLLEALRADLGEAPIESTPGSAKVATPKQRNKRDRGALDPYALFTEGEDVLRRQLSTLSVEQLKDIVSEHALDSSRLALKWKTAPRLIDLITQTVRGRVEKGDAFRS